MTRMKKKCRECGGKIEIIGADDCSMTVECTSCGEVFDVEPDAFSGDCMDWVEAMMEFNMG